MTIVGVVADTRRTGFDAAVRPETWLPHAQSPARTLEVVIRTAGPPLAVVPDLRANGVGALDPVSFAAAAMAAIVTTVLACVVPALRAMRVDPISALRVE